MSRNSPTLYVGTKKKEKFPDSVNDSHLKAHFRKCKGFRNAIVARDESKQSRGFGLVFFYSIEDAEVALQDLNGSVLVEKYQLFLDFYRGKGGQPSQSTNEASPQSKRSRRRRRRTCRSDDNITVYLPEEEECSNELPRVSKPSSSFLTKTTSAEPDPVNKPSSPKLEVAVDKTYEEKETELITEALHLSPQKLAYLKLLVSQSSSDEGKILNSLLKKFSVEIDLSCKGLSDTCALCGTAQAVDEAKNEISKLFTELQFFSFELSANSYHMELVKKSVLRKDGVLYEYVEQASSSPSFKITVYSKQAKAFKNACDRLTSVKPVSCPFPIHVDALEKQKSIKGFEGAHQVKVQVLRDPEPLVMLHALNEVAIQSCWEKMEPFLKCAITVTKEVKVKMMHALYIQEKHAKELEEFQEECRIQFPALKRNVNSMNSTLSVEITGLKSIVQRACRRIKQVSAKCIIEKADVSITGWSKKLWVKRWDEFCQEMEEKHDVLIKIQYPHWICTNPKDPQCYDPISVSFFICGTDRKKIDSTVQLLEENENGELIEHRPIALREKDTITLLSGLKNKLLDPSDEHSVLMKIDREGRTRTVNLMAPKKWESHLWDAEVQILKFVGNQRRIRSNYDFNDPVAALVCVSKSFDFMDRIEEMALEKGVKLVVNYEPRIQLILWGAREFINDIHSFIKSLVNEKILPLLSTVQFNGRHIYSSLFDSKEFIAFNSQLKDDFCSCVLSYQIVLKKNENGEKEDSPKSWFWVNDEKQLIPYPEEVSKELMAYSARSSYVSYRCEGRRYNLDASSMCQINIETGAKRKILCCPAVYQWYYIDLKSFDFKPYNLSISKELEATYKSGRDFHSLSYNGEEYTFDLKEFVQTAPYEVPIKREPTAVLPPEKKVEVENEVEISLRGPKENLASAQLKVLENLKSMITKEEIELPSDSTPRWEALLKQIAKSRGLLISSDAVPGQARKISIEGPQDVVNSTVIKLQSEIINFHSSYAGTAVPEKPVEWDEQTDVVEMFEVSRYSEEWRNITSQFKETLPETDIKSIKRIQNKWLWERYVQHRKRVDIKNSGRVNEKSLFHGTSQTRPDQIFSSEEGFDMRFSAKGLWGEANYFAENASYSDHYAFKTYNGDKQILLARVITGDSITCGQDQELRMPPKKPSMDSDLDLRYDTVKGFTGGSTVYMTYSNEKSYPAYLIQYRFSPYLSAQYRPTAPQYRPAVPQYRPAAPQYRPAAPQSKTFAQPTGTTQPTKPVAQPKATSQQSPSKSNNNCIIL